jgi:hypothetical protein
MAKVFQSWMQVWRALSILPLDLDFPEQKRILWHTWAWCRSRRMLNAVMDSTYTYARWRILLRFSGTNLRLSNIIPPPVNFDSPSGHVSSQQQIYDLLAPNCL